MTRNRLMRIGIATILTVVIASVVVIAVHLTRQASRVHVAAYFDNSNGIFPGDNVLIRGVAVGEIERIDPEPSRVKINFWFDEDYPVSKDVKAVILSPTLVTARAIQLTPPYSGGPRLKDHDVIPQTRTAVPVEWDDIRKQLERLTTALQPTEPGGTSTLGSLIHTAAENLRGQGAAIRDSIIKLSQMISTLGDHSDDLFTSVKNLSVLVTALQDSTDLIESLNVNLASVTGLLASDPAAIANAVSSLNDVVGEVKTFVADNRESLGTTSDKVASVSTALTQSLGDIKQLLHVLPNTVQNGVNIYQPAQGTLSGIAAVNNFADPVTFLCGAVEAASRLGAEQSAKLCVQYLAPIVKNRQYNFPPLGFNPLVGTSARPNEVTYSEDWMRPDFVPPQPAPAPLQNVSDASPPLAAEAAPTDAAMMPPDTPSQPTDPTEGLPGIMLPTGAR